MMDQLPIPLPYPPPPHPPGSVGPFARRFSRLLRRRSGRKSLTPCNTHRFFTWTKSVNL